MSEVSWDEGLVARQSLGLSLDETVELVRRLDGRERTLVTVVGEPGHLGVGGSAAAGLVVYVTFDNLTFHQLTDGSEADDPVDVVAGGQTCGYARRFVVAADRAETAVRAFLSEGGLAGNLEWESSGS